MGNLNEEFITFKDGMGLGSINKKADVKASVKQ